MGSKGKGIHLTEDEGVILDGDEAINGVVSIQSTVTLFGRVLATRSPNAQALKATMKGAWKLKNEFFFTEIKENLFSFQFADEGDKNKVLTGGPWSFDKALLVLREPGLEQANRLGFDQCCFWIRIYDLPIAAQTKPMAERIGAVFGGIVEMDEGDLLISSRFIRMKVKVDLTKALRRGLMLTLGGKKIWAEIKYERLPNFCYSCGRLGHVELECDNEEAKEYDGEYGDWMRASPIKVFKEKSAADRERARLFLQKLKGGDEGKGDAGQCSEEGVQEIAG